MFKEIFRNSTPVKETGFEYFDIQKDYDVSINFIQGETEIPPHPHDQEVFNYVFSDELSIIVDDKEQSYTAGDWIHISAGKVHALKTVSDVTLLELWKR